MTSVPVIMTVTANVSLDAVNREELESLLVSALNHYADNPAEFLTLCMMNGGEIDVSADLDD